MDLQNYLMLILGGKTSMEGILGEPIEYLAYPGGF